VQGRERTHLGVALANEEDLAELALAERDALRAAVVLGLGRLAQRL